jgi:hypothetical protein
MSETPSPSRSVPKRRNLHPLVFAVFMALDEDRCDDAVELGQRYLSETDNPLSALLTMASAGLFLREEPDAAIADLALLNVDRGLA